MDVIGIERDDGALQKKRHLTHKSLSERTVLVVISVIRTSLVPMAA